MKKRLLSLLLVLAMVGTMLPLSALAEEPDPATPAPEAETFAEETAEEAPDTPEPAAAEAPAPVEDVRLGDDPGVQKTYLVNAVDSGYCGDDLHYTLTDDGVLTISGTGKMTDYETFNPYWYSERSSITKVVIQEGVTTVGERAFFDCDNLTSVSLPKSLTTIMVQAFCNCSNLSSISFPDKLDALGDSSFAYCESLTSVFIPASVTHIYRLVFSSCFKLTSIIVDSANAYYSSEGGVLYNKDKTELLCCPGGKSGTFTVPSNVTSIGSGAFYGCQNLTSVKIPSSVTRINKYAFEHCKQLTSIVIPPNVTEIDPDTFRYCASLNTVVIPGGITSIGGNAFNGCKVKDVCHAGTYTDWNNINFGDGNSSLTDANVHHVSIVSTCGDNAYWSYCNDSTLLIFGSGAMKNYSINEAPWYSQQSRFQSVILQEGITHVGNYAFYGFSSLSSFSLPSTITYVGNHAFTNCSGLSSLSLSDSLKSIGDYAFYNCDKLTSVSIPENVTSIGDYAFSNCSGLSSLFLPVSLKSIGDYAFYNCDKLTSVSIPENVTSIGTRAFGGCDELTRIYVNVRSLTYSAADGLLYNNSKTELICCPSGISGSVSVPSGVTAIRDYAFYHCKKITSVILPSGFTSIGASAFNTCSLTTIVIPKSTTSIAENAFQGCSRLTDVYYIGSKTDWSSVSIGTNNDYLKNATIHYNSTSGDCGNGVYWVLSDGVLTIFGNGAMANYFDTTPPWTSQRDSIQSVIIQSGVTSVGHGAFRGCTNLVSVSLPSTLTSIASHAFDYCSSLTSVTIPASVTTILSASFYACESLTAIHVNSSNPNYTSEDGILYSKDRTTLVCFPASKSGDFTIPSGVTSIEPYAFYSCKKLTSVTIPYGVTTIGGYAFSRCNITSVIIPYGVTAIGPNTFQACTGLTTAVIPSSITAIEHEAFWGCSKLKDVLYGGTELDWNYINIGKDNDFLLTAARHYNCTCGTDVYWFLRNGVLTILGSGAMEQYSKTDTAPWYSEADSIQSVKIEAGVTSIGNYAFYNCKSITSVTIPDSVTAICNYAFYQCDKLTSVSIPANVTGIGMCAFSSCGALTSINVSSSNANFSSADGVLYNKNKTELLCCPGGKSGAFTVPAGVTAIGKYAFYGCLKLSSVLLPSGAEKIDSGAFSSCGLTTIFLPKSLSAIVSSAFYGCKALTDVYYGGSETDWSSISIGSSNTPLKNAAIHYSSTCGTNVYWMLADGVLTIFGSGAMKDYTTTNAAPWASQAESIQSVVIQSGVKSIGDRAFYSCSKLSEVSLPSGVESIGTYALGNCSSLTTITIPASVTSIHTNPFTGCTSLTAINVQSSNPNYSSVDGVLYNKDKTELIACPNDKAGVFIVPSGVTFIDSGAFYGCKKLTSVLLPAGLDKIYNYAFYNCTALTTIELPQSTAIVFKNAFTNCTKLRDVYYPGTEAEWNAINFDNANTLLTGADRHYCPVGDINNDGKRTLQDVSLLFQWWNGKSISSGYLSRTALCNANGDDGTDLRDAALIYRLVSENR